jgi:hypothetical protein
MLTKIVSFFGGPLGGIALKALSGLMIMGVILGMYKLHNDGIRREAIARQNFMQLEQVVEDQRRFISQLERINDTQRQTLSALREQNRALDTRLRNINQYLDSPEAQGSNRPSSDVLRNTIRQLSQQ